ncbi:MAG: HD domain-containing protein [Candidatus Sumerlaeia bacterium]
MTVFSDFNHILNDSERAYIREWLRSSNTDMLHMLQVSGLAMRLFDETMDLHGEDRKARRILLFAALLHDIGFSVDERKHHKHSRDLILEKGIQGLNRTEVDMVACVARYHRKAEPKPGHKIYRDLDPSQRKTVRSLAALLRLADGLDRSHHTKVRNLEVELRPGYATLILYSDEALGLELQGVEKKKPYFESLFQLRLSTDIRHAGS